MAKKKSNLFQITRTTDLHGLKIQDAYDKSKEFLDSSCGYNHKYVRVITGKSGEICREFPFWVETWRYSIVQSNIGNFIVKLS